MMLLFWLAVSALATDVSGPWVGGPFYFNLKEIGGKVSGTGGPSAEEQYIKIGGGTEAEGKVVFDVGKFHFELQVAGDSLTGEMTNGDRRMPVLLKRPGAEKKGPMAFEVASVKRAAPAPGASSSMNTQAGRLTCTNCSLKKLILAAYGVHDFQVSAPDWINTETYEIAATMSLGASGDDVQMMMQALLAERFKLAVHRESKELPMFALVQAKGGAKLQEVEFAGGSTSSGRGSLKATSIPMSKLADWLSGQVGRPVRDFTGLSGVYDLAMQWTAETENGPDLFTAMTQQLGLRLEARKGPVQMIVVDHVEKVPVEN